LFRLLHRDDETEQIFSAWVMDAPREELLRRSEGDHALACEGWPVSLDDVFEKRGGVWMVVSAHSTRIDEGAPTPAVADAKALPAGRLVEAPEATNRPAGGPSQITVMLFGETGRRFSGTCQTTVGTVTKTEMVQGALPANYAFRANALSCSVRKQATTGVLQMQFVVNGRSLKDQSTRMPFGELALAVTGLR